MKKIVFLFVTVLTAVTNVYSQSTQIASLSHGNDVTLYYGLFALQEAHENAVSGDIINLSDGFFKSTRITKSVILRGAGVDSENPTYILGDLEIYIPSEDANRFSMEGVRCGKIIISETFCNPFFNKCQIANLSIDPNSSEITRKLLFVNCKITNSAVGYGGKDMLTFINSYIDYYSYYASDSNASFFNCIIKQAGAFYGQCENCILLGNTEGILNLTDYVSYTNCVVVGVNNNPFENTTAKNCSVKNSFADVFKDFNGDYSDKQSFELTETAKTTLMGSDNTEVGLYGGLVPFDLTPSYPLITKLDVANRTTADGKLSVDIEVNAAE